MKTPYFCPFHAERMKVSESEALRCWSEMMRRGIHAYMDCRVEAADLYLGATLDIGLLRYQCAQNAMFSDHHVTKPADFLIELLCGDVRFSAAVATLSRISSAANTAGRNASADLLEWLAMRYAQVERAEKRYMSETAGDRARVNHHSFRYLVNHH